MDAVSSLYTGDYYYPTMMLDRPGISPNIKIRTVQNHLRSLIACMRRAMKTMKSSALDGLSEILDPSPAWIASRSDPNPCCDTSRKRQLRKVPLIDMISFDSTERKDHSHLRVSNLLDVGCVARGAGTYAVVFPCNKRP